MVGGGVLGSLDLTLFTIVLIKMCFNLIQHHFRLYSVLKMRALKKSELNWWFPLIRLGFFSSLILTGESPPSLFGLVDSEVWVQVFGGGGARNIPLGNMGTVRLGLGKEAGCFLLHNLISSEVSATRSSDLLRGYLQPLVHFSALLCEIILIIGFFFFPKRK